MRQLCGVLAAVALAAACGNPDHLVDADAGGAGGGVGGGGAGGGVGGGVGGGGVGGGGIGFGGGDAGGSGGGGAVDSGTDAGVDAGLDAGEDAGFDAGTDAGFDAGLPNYVFVTSRTFAGDFGGVTNADQACEDAAADAGLRPGAYRAWVSAPGALASARIAGRGWVRTDGLPFVDTISALTSQGQIFYPAILDEHRVSQLSSGEGIWTGTRPSGALDIYTCNQWSSADAGSLGVFGVLQYTGDNWTSTGYSPCNSAQRLLCFGTSATVPVVPVPPAPQRRAFLSTGMFTPGGGLSAADSLCQGEATAHGFYGQYLAFLATHQSSAAGRFDAGGPAWVRVDGVVLNAGDAGIFAPGELLATPNVTADGIYVTTYSAGTNAWSGASEPYMAGSTSTFNDQNCLDWTSNASTDKGWVGNSTGIDAWFGAAYGQGCNAAHRLYCFQE